MSVLAGIVKNVLVIIILASFFEILLPEGRLKPFVRFAVGLFILVSVLNPTLTYIFSDHEIKLNMWDYTDKYMSDEEILKKGNMLNEAIKRQSDTAVKEKIQGQISAVALLIPEVEDVTTEAYITDNGRLEKIHIIVRAKNQEPSSYPEKVGVFLNNTGNREKSEDELVKKKMINIIQNLYGLDSDYIQIEFEGG